MFHFSPVLGGVERRLPFGRSNPISRKSGEKWGTRHRFYARVTSIPRSRKSNETWGTRTSEARIIEGIGILRLRKPCSFARLASLRMKRRKVSRARAPAPR